MTLSSGNYKDPNHAEYIRLLIDNQSRIMTYILMMVPCLPDAEDIFQETAALMWEKYDQYEPGSDFASWAVTIARFKIMNWRRTHAHGHIVFSSRTVDLISESAAKRVEGAGSLQQWLRHCMERLNERDRALVELRYGGNITTRELARRVGRPVQGLYSSLSRIHALLLDCIQREKRADLL